MKAWRKCSFKKGEKYKVNEHTHSLRDRFRKGEVLIFQTDIYSRYDGMTGYVFVDEWGTQKVFDITDDEDFETANKLFTQIEV